MNILIIGGGNIGQAIYSALGQSQGDAIIYDKNTERSTCSMPLVKAAMAADFIFLCIPSTATEAVVKEIASSIKQSALIILLAKGLEPTSGAFLSDVVRQYIEPGQCVVLSGPMLADEINQGRQGMAVAASESEETFELIKNIFNPQALLLEYSSNIHGIALAGVLKNIYAITLGIAEGLDWGENKKGWLVSRAVKEMVLIANIFGLSEESMLGLAGLGDLIATGFSSKSHNHAAGLQMVKSGQVELSEGMLSLPHIIDKVTEESHRLPIIYALNDAVRKPRDVSAIFSKIP